MVLRLEIVDADHEIGPFGRTQFLLSATGSGSQCTGCCTRWAEQKFQGSALDGVIRRTEAETLMQKGHCETHVPLEVFARNARLQFALTNSSQEPVCG